MQRGCLKALPILSLVAALSACGGGGGGGGSYSGGDPIAVSVSGSDARATTALGSLVGVRSDGSLSFKGVRFAASTGGDRRWRPPQPSGAWTGALDATRFGNQCPSGNSLQTGASEDCLYLNVYVPETVAGGTRNLPVMFWIHGGANASGSASDYDPSLLVRQEGVIVVTTNYRVGVLGFLAHPSIDAESHPAANYGLLDQQLALRWVKDNIHSFGGDPGNVTVFGFVGRLEYPQSPDLAFLLGVVSQSHCPERCVPTFHPHLGLIASPWHRLCKSARLHGPVGCLSTRETTRRDPGKPGTNQRRVERVQSVHRRRRSDPSSAAFCISRGQVRESAGDARNHAIRGAGNPLGVSRDDSAGLRSGRWQLRNYRCKGARRNTCRISSRPIQGSVRSGQRGRDRCGVCLPRTQERPDHVLSCARLRL